MRRLPLYIFLVAATYALWACSGPKSIKIEGEILGGVNTNIYLKYYGNDAVRTAVTAAREGKFETEISSAAPTIVEIIGNDNVPLGRFYAKNGDKLRISIDRKNPYLTEVKGNSDNERWSKLMAENSETLISGDHQRINELIEEYIHENPTDVVSTLMFVSFYDSSIDPLRADSIVGCIDPLARPNSIIDSYSYMVLPYVEMSSYAPIGQIRYRTVESDSAHIFVPSDSKLSLIAISSENSDRTKEVVPELKEMYKDFKSGKFQILDIAIYADTSSWKRAVARDSAKWTQGWVPGGILGAGLQELAIPDVPFYIVTDSAGKQMYRGASVQDARDKVKELYDAL